MRRTLAQINSMVLCLVSKLAVTRNPLVMKKTSTAMVPMVIPRISRNGSASLDPVANAKLCVVNTVSAATIRMRLKLLSLPGVKCDKLMMVPAEWASLREPLLLCSCRSKQLFCCSYQTSPEIGRAQHAIDVQHITIGIFADKIPGFKHSFHERSVIPMVIRAHCQS